MGMRERGPTCGGAAAPCFAGATVTRKSRPLGVTGPQASLGPRSGKPPGYDLRGISVLHTEKRLGEYKCDLNQGGKSSMTISDTSCLKSCTERHEQKHQADVSPCCQAAGAAYKAAEGDGPKQEQIITDFTNWSTKNKPYFECRAYQESVTCAEEKIAELKAKDLKKFTQSDSDCLRLAVETSGKWTKSRNNFCGGTADEPSKVTVQFTPCPWTPAP